MYYNRTIPDDFAKNIMAGGPLHWLFEFVKSRPDLDFLIGKNNKGAWISVYRGLTRIMTIRPTQNAEMISIDAAPRYKDIAPELFGKKAITSISVGSIELIIKYLESKGKNDWYYGNEKEGYYQNELSRKFGICGNADSDFVIIDKEAVIGYKDEHEKNQLLSPLQNEYKELQRIISEIDPKRYGKNLNKKSIGNELDFLALNKEGDVLLIEYKHGTNTSGIYLSPLQIGLYFQLFSGLPQTFLQNAITEMFEQKKRMGLINANWKKPKFSGEIIPVLIISNPNHRSSAYEKFCEIFDFCKKKKGTDFLKNLRTYSYTTAKGLEAWDNL